MRLDDAHFVPQKEEYLLIYFGSVRFIELTGCINSRLKSQFEVLYYTRKNFLRSEISVRRNWCGLHSPYSRVAEQPGH